VKDNHINHINHINRTLAKYFRHCNINAMHSYWQQKLGGGAESRHFSSLSAAQPLVDQPSVDSLLYVHQVLRCNICYIDKINYLSYLHVVLEMLTVAPQPETVFGYFRHVRDVGSQVR
jgi:hypothetical protein